MKQYEDGLYRGNVPPMTTMLNALANIGALQIESTFMGTENRVHDRGKSCFRVIIGWL